MTRATFILFLVAILGIGGGVVWYLTYTREASLMRPGTVASSTTEVQVGQAIYTNGPYGFSLVYPETADVEYTFSASYHLGTTWRASALPDTTGVALLAIIPYATASDHSYPRYFNAMVRIGASEDPKEVAECLKPTSQQGEEELPDVVIQGHTWKAFSFQSAGMMQYAKGVSYRTLHEGKCIALEKIQTGSSYRDDPISPDDVSDEYLLERYEGLSSIITSFTFARP